VRATRIRPNTDREELGMFGFLRSDPAAKLQKTYEAKLRAARDLQRNGDVVGAARVSAEAEEIRKQIEARREED